MKKARPKNQKSAISGQQSGRRGAPKNMLFAFEAARRSGYRSWFWFPWLDPKDQIIRWTREEIARKLNFLYNNSGAARCVIDGLAREEVDTGIWPVPRTTNPEFNSAVKDAFHNDCADSRFFDEAAVENYHSQQLAIRRNIYLYGELFSQLLRPTQGSKIPTIHTIPSWQINNGGISGGYPSSASDPDWIDGTRANQWGRVYLYRAVTGPTSADWVNIPADDLLHFHDSFWKGQRRGLSCLASVAMKLFSIDDIERSANVGELLRQRIAYQITKGPNDSDEPTLVPGATVVDTVEMDEGIDGVKTKLHIQRIQSTDGADVDIADLPPGRKLEMVESAKGGDAIRWNEHMLEEIARATPYPPDYVFFLGRIGQGTVYRGLQKRVQRSKNIIRHLQLKPQFCERWYTFWLWQSILGGRFDDVEGGVPKDWFKRRWNFPSDDSVDIGREGNLMDDRLESGKITLSTYRSAIGGDPEDDDQEIVETRIRRLKIIHDARADMRDDPDYADLADDLQLSYEMIFKENKVATRITEAETGLEQQLDVGGGQGGTGSKKAVRTCSNRMVPAMGVRHAGDGNLMARVPTNLLATD